MLAINPQQIDVWHGDLTPIDQPLYLPLLASHERNHAQNLTQPAIRQRYIQVRATLRSLLSRYLNQAPESIDIRSNQHGKPYLHDYPELVFNLSHSGDYLVIALANRCQLGIDIELCKARANLPLMVNKCFNQTEAVYWQSLPENQKTSVFYQFWTRKEAFVKATGRGIALGLQQCVIDVENHKQFQNLPAAYGEASIWQITPIAFANKPQLIGAVVADQAIASVNWHTWVE